MSSLKVVGFTVWMTGLWQNAYKNRKKTIFSFLPINSFLYVGTPSGIRTLDPLIKSQLLYQLS